MPEQESKGGCNRCGPYDECGHTTDTCPEIAMSEETTENTQEEVENERVKQRIIEVKEIVERKEIRPNVKEILQNVGVMAVIADLRPLSQLAVKTEMESGLFQMPGLLSETDIDQLEQVLSELGVTMDRLIKPAEQPLEITHPSEQFRFYKKENILKTINEEENRKYFTDTGVTETIEEDIDIESLVNNANELQLHVLRGDPKCDIEDYDRYLSIGEKYKIKERNLQDLFEKPTDEDDSRKEDYGINDEDWKFISEKTIEHIVVRGSKKRKNKKPARDSIMWPTFNLTSPEVQARKKQFENMVGLQEEVFGY